MKTTTKKSVVMFEVSDSGREWETSGESYLVPFAEFLSSLGLPAEATEGYKPDEVMIDGIKFYVNYKSCSYKAKSAYATEYSIRKPQNRFIGLMRHSFDKEHIVKIFFNKEYDGNEIRAKIEAAIQKDKEVETAIANRQERDKECTIQTAKHYLAQPTIKKETHSITVHESLIKFHINGVGEICIRANGDLHLVHIYKKEAQPADIDAALQKQITNAYLIQQYLNEIKAAGPVVKDIQEWSEKAYNRHFYVPDMEYSKH